MKVLVAGKSGQLALALQEACRELGLAHVGAGRPDFDILDPAAISRVLEAHQPDVVINAAAWTDVEGAERDPDGATRLNGDAAGRLAAATAQQGALFVHVSSDFVFDGAGGAPYREDATTAPLNAYGRSKLAGEHAVLAAAPRSIVARTAWVHSAWSRNFVRTMLRLAETREEIGVVDDQRGSPTYAGDLAAGLLTAANKLRGAGPNGSALQGLLHVAPPDAATWADVAEETFAASSELGGPSARVRRITTAEFPTPTVRPADSRLDVSRLREVFGVQLPGWRSGVRRSVARLLA